MIALFQVAAGSFGKTEMKVGDLVAGTEDGTYDGDIGIIFGFDEDDDPIVFWCTTAGSNEASPGCGEYRSHVEILNEAR